MYNCNDKKYKPHTVIDGTEYLVEDENGDTFGGEWQDQFLKSPKNMITVGHHTDPMRGPRRPSQYTVDSLLNNMLITGLNGYGVKTLSLNMKTQLVNRGQGVSFIDIQGESSKDLLKHIPEDRLDDVVWIEPSSTHEKNIGFNILNTAYNPDDIEYEREVNMRTMLVIELFKEYSEYWGPQIGNITETLVRQLIRAEEPFNLIDLVKIIADKEERALFAENYSDDSEFLKRIAEENDDAFEPILRRVREWVSDRDTRNMICAPKTDLNLVEAVKKDKIIILNTENIESSSSRDIIIQTYIKQLWLANRIALHDEHFLFIDYCHKIESALSGLPEIMSDSRGVNFGVIPISAYLDNFDKEIKSALRKSGNLIALNVGPEPSTQGTVAQLLNISANELAELDQFEAMSKVVSKEGYKSDIVVKIKLLHCFKPEREEIDSIIELSINNYGFQQDISIDLKNYGMRRFMD